jgi:DNA-binding XRE family transcriptional regulator
MYVVEILRVFHHVDVRGKRKSVEEIHINREIARRLREFRERAGLTQEDIEDYGIHVRQYQRLESGKQTPTIPTLIQLSKILNVKLSDFFK